MVIMLQNCMYCTELTTKIKCLHRGLEIINLHLKFINKHCFQRKRAMKILKITCLLLKY